MSEISQYTESLHEECGVFGMYDKTGETDMVSAVYSALYALQHRGQESCGIALNVDGVLSGYRDLGLVSEVFTKRVLEELPRGHPQTLRGLSLLPSTPMISGRVRMDTTWNSSVRRKEIAADTAPLFSAVKNAEPKMLKPDRIKLMQYSFMPWVVSASSPAS